MIKQLILIIAIASSTLFAENMHYNFEKIDLTKWQTYGKWDIGKEGNKHSISMTNRSEGNFNFCYAKDVHFLNGKVNVAFNANAGSIDQGGGIMWRVQDNDNYYVARFNPLEDNFRFYIVHDGIRSELASADVKLSKGWHTMTIEQKGDTFKGYLDDKPYLEYKDTHLNKVGAVGVWTKSDAQTSFSNLSIVIEK